MKRVLKVLGVAWLLGIGLSLRAQMPGPGYRLLGTVSLQVPVSGMKMTNLVFPVPVAAGVKVSKDVLVQRPKGIENVIELKAVRLGFAPTNLSVFGKDGRLYSFDLHYVQDTAVLNYRVVLDEGALAGKGHPVMLSGLPVDMTTLDKDAPLLGALPGFLHSSVRASGMRLQLRGIYLRDSLLWLCLRLSNRTAIGFMPAYVRVFVEDRKRLKRTASQEVTVMPVYSSPLSAVSGRGSQRLTVGLTPFALARGKNLVIELADASGDRVLALKMKGKMVLRARVSR
jgi:hypothetical protein